MATTATRIMLTSSAFTPNGVIPLRFSRDGEDVSPALSWSGAPANARELALIVDDPDAPTPKPWVHWVIYKLPQSSGGLPEKMPMASRPPTPSGSLQGKNSWGNVGYNGPQPPHGHGVHHYHFKLYALDVALDVHPGLDKDQLLEKMQGHIIAEGELVGTYKR